ncbi:hypothetical protein FAZ19_16220 [Sphingobacterium alkalisoli]|uniref:Uncharacterized protein n=1 Tax=Sphingobacterium alkalisoli TaxID=1874115 RepID=A0A4U0H0S9_9SPHI|nr:hypothetical protein [Sphingobacterium alkalisoli]TJY63812.1 hypothetical protein FAZ19_16220 [Sphingobacterium alkalisoli]GGH24734.1 hypothetical protein GCM10011418_32840 [Sphingobacterium alkalisoli]
MNAVKEFFEPVKNRLNNSVVGSFFLSWCLVSWKFLFVLFVSSLPVIERISLAEEQINHYIAWLVPFLFTVFYVFLLPRLENWITKINKSIVLEKEKSVVDLEISVVKEKTRLAKENIVLEKAQNEVKNLEELNEKVLSLEEDMKIANETIEHNEENREKLKKAHDQLAIKYPAFRDDLEKSYNGKPLKKSAGETMMYLDNVLKNMDESERDDLILESISALNEKEKHGAIPVLVQYLSDKGKAEFSNMIDWTSSKNSNKN